MSHDFDELTEYDVRATLHPERGLWFAWTITHVMGHEVATAVEDLRREAIATDRDPRAIKFEFREHRSHDEWETFKP